MTSTLLPRSPAESSTETVHVVMPGDANALDAAFGGSVMGWIDVCAAVAAQRHSRQSVVTASMDELHFHEAIRVGWTANIHARLIAAFNSSMEVGVAVHAENPRTGERHLTTSALLTFVSLDQDGRRLAVPPLLLSTEAERLAAAEAANRRAQRLARKDQRRGWLSLLGVG
jgi:acyl-CoA hydrolase